MSKPEPTRWVSVFDHDGDHDREGGPAGPFIFEHYLNECTREAALARISCTAARDCGAGRLAVLDFDLGGEPTEPHVVVAGFDGINRDRGPLVLETVLKPDYASRDAANKSAARLDGRYGACRIARLVFEDTTKN